MSQLPAGLKGSAAAERDCDSFLVRIRIPGGLTNPKELAGIARIAQKFGISRMHLSSNQTVELLHAAPEDLQNLASELEKNGTPIDNAVRNRVSVVSCPGTESCPHAQIETFSLVGTLQKYYTESAAAPKVRIAVSGCPNSCSNERECEIGITGVRKPLRDAAKCTGCGGCLSVCLEDAVEIVNGKLELNEEKCLFCGQCISACQYNCISFTNPGYLISLGGKAGRRQKTARAFAVVQSEEEVCAVIGALGRILADKSNAGPHFLRRISDAEFAELGKDVCTELKKTGIGLQQPPKAYR